jgi:mRNA interferase RelE/StbE
MWRSAGVSREMTLEILGDSCDAALALNPHRVGKPLFGPLAGCHGARRGTYRVVYRIDENHDVVHVLDIDHRLEIYHQR